MPFGIVFIDDNGATWTVGPLHDEHPSASRGLRFCRPSFLRPIEVRVLTDPIEGWPSCSAAELRRALARAGILPRVTFPIPA